ncbi:MAG: hypothetical protein GY756_06860 [bacterium]|nr:hypothetical protein [bacterium]
MKTLTVYIIGMIFIGVALSYAGTSNEYKPSRIEYISEVTAWSAVSNDHRVKAQQQSEKDIKISTMKTQNYIFTTVKETEWKNIKAKSFSDTSCSSNEWVF